MKYEITKEFTFDAAHYLHVVDESNVEESHKVYGKCSEIHGHTYKLQVTVGADTLRDGMVINFTELKEVVSKSILEDVDHKLLNNVSWLSDIIPTCEAMLERFWMQLAGELLKHSVYLVKLVMYETPTSWGEYRG